MSRAAAALMLFWLVLPAPVLGQALPAATADEARTAPLDRPLPRDPALVFGRFDNGLTYYIRENGEPANRAELRLVVKVGSIVEDDDQRGLAHVLEHMAFNGTERFEKQELVAFMESIGMQLGADVNAGTSFDQTIYMLRVPTGDPEHLRTAFRIIEDWTSALTLDPDEVEQERRIVIEEWRGGRNANARVQDRQIAEVLAGSRYAERLPIGTLESLQSFEHDALRRFYEDWYRPDLMAVIAVGDFEAETVETLVRDHFEHLPMPENPRERVRYDVPDHEGTRYSIVTDPELPATSIGLAHRLDTEEDRTIGGVRRRLAESLYAGMLVQRLGEIAQQPAPPWVLAVAAKTESFLSLGPAYVMTALVQGDGIERALAALVTESERAMRFGFTEAELERAKSSLLRQAESRYENRASISSQAHASIYAAAFTQDRPIPGIEYEYELARRFVPELGLEEVDRIADGWAGDASRIVLITAPENDTLDVPGEAVLAAVLDEAAGAPEIEAYADAGGDLELLPSLPEGSPVVASRETPAGVTEWDLANGVRVILKPTDFDEDVILFRAFSPGGLSLAPDEALVPARTAIRVIANGGLGELDATRLRQALAGTIAAANPSISEFGEGLSGNASRRDLETLFQLIYLRFTAPRADEAAFDVFKAQGELFLRNRSASPAQVFADRFTQLMTQDHPRRQPETIEMLEQADLDGSLEFYRDRFSDAGDFTFVFVGSLDLAAMQPLVERYLGGLPSTGREESWRDVGVRPPPGTVEETIHQGLEPVGRTRIAITGPIVLEDVAERTLLAATARVLQSRLRDVLREDLGATYNVTVASSTAWLPEKTYTVIVEFTSDPARIDELVETVFTEIETLRSEGPALSQVADVREAMLRQYEVNLEQNAYWAGLLTASYQFGFDTGEEWERAYPASIESLSPEAVRAGAERYLDTERYLRLSLLPESMDPSR